MNLREEKHWSYGARSMVVPARGQRPFLVMAPVQSDKTREAVTEIEQELQGVRGKEPVTAAELTKAQQAQTLTLPGRWETIAAVGRAVGELVRFRLPADYYETYPDKVRALDIPQVVKAAETVIDPKQLLWVVVGDREKVEPTLKDLGFAEIQLIDTDGKSLN
jgi:zinc protease